MKRMIVGVISFGLAAGAAACSDSPAGTDDTPHNANSSIVVSNAITTTGTSNIASINGASFVSSAAIAYVSTPRGTFPDANLAVIRNQTRADVDARRVAVIEGGFDPVRINAEPDDELSITLTGDAGTTVFSVIVPRRKPPTVVRTNPSKGRTDVALNVQIFVVFSEPVEASALTFSSIRLLRDGNAVSGHVALSTDGLIAEFIPDVQLQALTTYSLTVSEGIRDLAGDALAEASVVPFTTSTPGGSLRLTTLTTGVDQDSDGYSVLESRLRDLVDWDKGLVINVPSNGTVSESGVSPGTYELVLSSVAPNCEPAVPSPLNVTVTAGAETSLTVQIKCDPPTQIAFVRGAGQQETLEANIANTDIYVINSSGRGTTRLTSSPGADLNPAWSPDGTRIAFASDRTGNREIFVMNADGSNPVRLTDNPAGDYLPAWSPDGKRIAFVSERNGNPDIHVMNADGTAQLAITSSSAVDTEPSWSPDGSRIAFRSGRNDPINSGSIYAMNPDGSAVVQLTSGTPFYPHMEPVWSPDGTRIAFRGPINAATPGYPYIYTMNAQGSDIRPLMFWVPTLVHHPEWSPDGKLIAFDDRDCWDYGPCPRGIIIGTAAGRFSMQIDDASEPAWRPRK